jgi:hypothetical protein
MRNVGRSVGPIGTNSHAQSETSATTTGYIATVWCPLWHQSIKCFQSLNSSNNSRPHNLPHTLIWLGEPISFRRSASRRPSARRNVSMR